MTTIPRLHLNLEGKWNGKTIFFPDNPSKAALGDCGFKAPFSIFVKNGTSFMD
jgi:hypothetical protein